MPFVRTLACLFALASPLVAGSAGAQVTASLSPATLAFGNVTVTTDSAAQFVTLTNTSVAAGFTVNSLSPEFRYRDVAGGTCQARPFVLAANTSCTIAIVFNPNSLGSFPASLTVSTTPSATFTPTSVTLGGTGVAVPVSLSPATLSFGSIEVGATSAAQLVTVRNDDAAAMLTVNSVSVGFRYAVAAGGSCGTTPFSLAPGQQCTIALTFAPNSTGSFPAAFSISTTPSSSPTPASVTLGGVGAAIPATLSPANIAFGNVSIGTTSAPRLFTIANASTMSASTTINSVSLGFRYSQVAGGTCAATPFTLAAGESCSIAVVFSPNSAGNFTASASANATPTTTFAPVSIGLSGTGTALPATLAPANLAFGNVTVGTTSASRTVTIANADPIGSFSVTSISPAFRYTIAPTGSCGDPPFELGPGASCTVDVRFSPNSLGNFTGALSFQTSPATSLTPASVGLGGTGTPVPVLYEPATLAFGPVLVGASSAPRAFAIANADPAASLTVTAASLGFRYRLVPGGSCGEIPFTLAAGASCELHVVFEPNTLGNFAGFVTLTTTPASDFEPAQVTLGGSGAGAELFRDGFE
jgi:hypothetical protein